MEAASGTLSLGELSSAATLAVCLALVCLALTRLPESRLARPLVAMVACTGLWMVGDTITLVSRTMPVEQLGIALLYSGAIFLPPCWWRLSLHWADLHRVRHPFGHPYWLRLPFWVAASLWLSMITNPWHGQFLTPVIGAANELGPLWWVAAIPSYGLIWLSVGLLAHAWLRCRLPQPRREAGFLLAATLVTALWHVFGLTTQYAAWHGTLTSLALSAALVVFGLYRDRILGLLPVAFRGIVDGDPDGLLILGADGSLLHANARAHAVLAPTPLEPGVPVPFAGLDQPARLRDRDLCEAPTGERVLELRRQTLLGRRGRVRAHCIRLRDVTDEREAEARLARGARLDSLAELARGVAHDFHNLLAVIGGNAELLEADRESERADGSASRPEAERRLARIHAAVKQASDLAAQLRLYAGAGEPQRELVELGPAVREVAELFEPEPGLPLRLRLAGLEAPLTVWADATQLRQVLQNLLVNAAESLGDDGGDVTVTCQAADVAPAALGNLIVGHGRPRGRYAQISVCDTGVGMDRATRERIFDPFFGTKGKHRGLGLSIVVGFVRSHEGLLSLETAPGRGSTFSVLLPCEG